MNSSPLFVLAILAGVLSACNNNEADQKDSQQANATGTIDHNTSVPTSHAQSIPQSPFIKVSNPAPTTSALTIQEIRSLLRNDILVKTMPVNFLYPNASLIVSKGRTEDNIFSLSLVSKQAGQGLKQHFLRRVFPEGNAPDFPVIFTMNADQDSADELVVLCRWRILHRGLGIDANLYQPIVFDNVVDPATQQVRVLKNITNVLGEGYDGRMEQGREFYAYKDQASLQRKIVELRQ
ncbi:MAG: Unknown protein [uncultured Thiotrichaceae bacterium]|uniref:Lipoprotein n=1 Tax=uncultured Thiotrichaceae bacterium TaxID=298394 RepID=A0A6S6TRQ6_9GAMM|nr:MAG: Unknown protein [uncultured Thiotrichaceae bacterium]